MLHRRFLAALAVSTVLAVATGPLPAFADKPDGGDAEVETGQVGVATDTRVGSADLQALVTQFQQAAADASSPAGLVKLFKALAAKAGADRRSFAQALALFMRTNHGLSRVAIEASRKMESEGDSSDAEEVVKATLEATGQSVTGSTYGQDGTVTGSTYAGDESVSGATYGQSTVSGDVYAEKEKEMEDAYAELGRIYQRAKKDRDLHVFVNGVEPAFDVKPVVEHGRALVPVRAIVEALKATVSWDGANDSVTVQANGHTVVFTIGSKVAVVDGQSVTLDVAPVIRGGRTLLPLRAIAQLLGVPVRWQAQGNIAVVGLGAGGGGAAGGGQQ
ncbi:MAG: copper amine oxidase N-terminal domain-containing protein [Bacillota bacterium]|nr:copper amine oxidase N-terminal domain-containing protein [Bacillota bacterium]